LRRFDLRPFLQNASYEKQFAAIDEAVAKAANQANVATKDAEATDAGGEGGGAKKKAKRGAK